MGLSTLSTSAKLLSLTTALSLVIAIEEEAVIQIKLIRDTWGPGRVTGLT
jgi:hypothetical protein